MSKTTTDPNVKFVSNPLLSSLNRTFNECLSIAEKKNSDYSPGENPFRNFENTYLAGVKPERGILVRMIDKLSRISNLLDRKEVVTDEKITDTLNDLINYTAILKAYLENK